MSASGLLGGGFRSREMTKYKEVPCRSACARQSFAISSRLSRLFAACLRTRERVCALSPRLRLYWTVPAIGNLNEPIGQRPVFVGINLNPETPRPGDSVPQHNTQQRAMHFQISVVVDKAQLPEFVHEEADTRACRADYLR